ncbi:MAG TPA: 16S rRNA (guanine(527)-N(7))-methyltransferase RsmG [Burkholderiaceae bacterium]|nr:16S rRNA (guanine(527)-N(7))-methyltransferase RsmG [Burkholderiaceae bacterium]
MMTAYRRPEAGGAESPLAAEHIAAAAQELGLQLCVQQAQQLSAYAQLLMRWNARVNLTALRAPEQILSHHLLDSLAIVPALMDLNVPSGARVLDVGSGAGLPGIVLAIMMPNWRLTLIDTVGKKAAFLTQVKLELGLEQVEVIHGRVQDVAARFDVIVSRAFSALDQFVHASYAQLAAGGVWAAMQGLAHGAKAGQMVGSPNTHPRDSGCARIDKVVKLRVPRLAAQRHLIVMRPWQDAQTAATREIGG